MKLKAAFVAGALVLAAELGFLVGHAFAPKLDTAALAKAVAAELDREDYVRQDLLKHPDILVDAVNQLKSAADAASSGVLARAESAAGAVEIPAKTQPSVAVLSFEDFNCPYCRLASASVERLLQERPDVRFVFRELPIIHPPQSRPTALIALALARQGKYVAFYKAVMAQRGLVDEAGALQLARGTGADMTRLGKDLRDPALAADLAQDLAYARALDVTGTPTFFINGRRAEGAIPYADLTAEIDAAKKAETKGTPNPPPATGRTAPPKTK